MMDSKTLERLRYPFPTLVNPHAAAIQEHTNRCWIDGEWKGFVPSGVAEKFKKVQTGYMTSYFFPMATWDRLIPLARMMLFSLYQDDIYERARPDDVRHLRERTIAVAKGEMTASDAGVMLAPQIEILRSELLKFLPAASVARWASDLDLYFEGLIAETSLLETGAYPSLSEYMRIREKALMLHPFIALKEVETRVILPAELHEHPTLRRIKSLTVRITGWFNEFQSYEKDMRTGMKNVNLINVLMNEYNTTLEDARERAFHIHDTELAEFLQLQRTLPDITSESRDMLENHVHHLSFIISGWRGVDSVVERYDPQHYIDEESLSAVAQSTRSSS